ncbi:MAG: flagellar assembly protein FliX [Pseudomonadota bacterium]
MKITGPGATDKTTATRRSQGAGKAGAAGFSDLLGGAEDVSEAAPSAATHAIANIDSLLAAQASDDPADRASRGRMMGRADNVLDALEGVRRSILAGTLTVGQVVDIADVVASHREKIADPQLTALLDEVDLRAQIEIAKMAQALKTCDA